MKVVYQASQVVGIHGMFVEALNDNAKNSTFDWVLYS